MLGKKALTNKNRMKDQKWLCEPISWKNSCTQKSIGSKLPEQYIST